jgi:E3 ubiquitin-protein ligase RNF14
MLPDCVAHIQEVARDGFGLRELTLSSELLLQLLECGRTAAKDEFNKMSYDCSACQYRKQGIACYQFEHCGHVSCVACLQEGYNNAILAGNIDRINCFDCHKEQ